MQINLALGSIDNKTEQIKGITNQKLFSVVSDFTEHAR
jgi:hypothetical protein